MMLYHAKGILFMSGLIISKLFQYTDTQNVYNNIFLNSTLKSNSLFENSNFNKESNSKFLLINPSDESTYLKLKNHKNLTIPKNVNIENMKDTTRKALLAAVKWADENGYKVTITSGYRPLKYQARLYKKNPGIADAPKHSMHCKGLAFDIGLIPKDSNKKSTDPKLYLSLAQSLKKENFDVYNGREFTDAPKDIEWKEAWHFQMGKNDGFLFAKSKKHVKK